LAGRQKLAHRISSSSLSLSGRPLGGSRVLWWTLDGMLVEIEYGRQSAMIRLQLWPPPSAQSSEHRLPQGRFLVQLSVAEFSTKHCAAAARDFGTRPAGPPHATHSSAVIGSSGRQFNSGPASPRPFMKSCWTKEKAGASTGTSTSHANGMPSDSRNF